MGSRWKRVAGIAVVTGVLAFACSVASAELSAHGDLFVKFSGGIAPTALPRSSRAPVTVSVTGTVRTLSGERPPALRGISIAINRGGRLDTHGLPRCRQREIEPASTEEALAVCGDALVGDGSYSARVAFPEQSSFPSHGKIVAFNAVVGGQRAILAQVYDSQPVPITRVIVVRIRQRGGTFGTVLTASLPSRLNQYGYLKQISLRLHRDFVFQGRQRSYLSASCAAPHGFTGAVFPFARAAMRFEDGRTLASTLTRTCQVQG